MLSLCSIYNMCWFYLLNKQNVWLCVVGEWVVRASEWVRVKKDGIKAEWSCRAWRQRRRLDTNKNENHTKQQHKYYYTWAISSSSVRCMVSWFYRMRCAAFLFTKCKLWFWICHRSLTLSGFIFVLICKSVRRSVYTNIHTHTHGHVHCTCSSIYSSNRFVLSFFLCSFMIYIFLLAKDIGFILSWR